jgi:hypothetical protein
MKPMHRSTFLLSVVASAGLTACAHEDEATPITPDVPAAGVTCPARGPLAAPGATLAPPDGAQPFLRVYAEGTQIYTCQATVGGAPAWTFKAPEAKLYDDRCVLVGTHFAGPTWQLDRDGSAVVAKKMSESPGTAGAIPWLLLATTTTSGTGKLTDVHYINRIDTAGGTAPTAGCDATTLGQELKVPYTATYLYYR